MNVPRLEIYLDQEANLCISTVEIQNDKHFLVVDVPLNEMKAFGPEGAAHRIGGAILNIMGDWHKQTFENWEVVTIKESQDFQADDDYSSALRLISRTLSAKTIAHNASIEYLLQQSATNSGSARKCLEDVWPLLRDRSGVP